MKIPDGTIFFQRIPTWVHWFSRMIVELQGSPWNHCGIVFEQHTWPRRLLGKYWVIEAFPKVGVWECPLWLARLRTFWAPLEFRTLNGADRDFFYSAAVHLGKGYDYGFRWSKDALYCSELLYDAYSTTIGSMREGATPCPLSKVSELNVAGWLDRIASIQRGKVYNGDHPIVTVRSIYEKTHPLTA